MHGSKINPHADGERIVGIRASSLERAIRNYVDHYHEERNHQGLGNELIRGDAKTELRVIEVRERLGGLLKY